MLFSCIYSYSQSIKGNYYGYWIDTNWKFEFSNNYKYKWTSSGHYGDTMFKGNYKIHADTIILTSGYENKDGVNKYYLIDGDTCIIDIDLKYDYCKTKPVKIKIGHGQYIEMHREQYLRSIMYPQLPTDNKSKIEEVENILTQVINWTALEKYYHSDTDSTRKPLVIQSYYEIKANNSIKLTKFGTPVVFKTEDEIKKERVKAFITLEMFNIASNYVKVNLKYDIEGVYAILYFYRNSIDKTWTLSKSDSWLHAH